MLGIGARHVQLIPRQPLGIFKNPRHFAIIVHRIAENVRENGRSRAAQPGSFSATNARTPIFCNPIELIIPAWVSYSRGAGLPSIGSRDKPFHHDPADLAQIHQRSRTRFRNRRSRTPPAPDS